MENGNNPIDFVDDVVAEGYFLQYPIRDQRSFDIQLSELIGVLGISMRVARALSSKE